MTDDVRMKYLIGDWLVDPNTNEITRGMDITRIEPRSMEVLVHLIEHAGEVISRDDIQDQVWGNVSVGQESITNAIIKIRKAFQDDARNPRVVETIPKRGYRLIAPIEPVCDPPPASLDAFPESRKKYAAAIRAVAVAVVLVVGVAAGRIAFQDPQVATANLTDVPADVVAGDRPSVAVRPFMNLSAEAGDAYLSRGVEETLLTNLAQLPQLSVMRFSEGVGDAGRQYIVEGSVLRAGDRIRIDTRLIRAGDGTVLWSQRFDRPFADLIAVEDEIRATIIGKLALSVSRAELKTRAQGYTDSVAAYDLFLRAQQALLPRDAAGNAEARKLYLKAIEHDPRFARAYAGLALTYAAEYRNFWVEDRQRALAEALRMAQAALQIAPDLPEQYWVIAYVRTQQRQFEAAEAALAQATRLDPDYADAYALLGGVNTYRGNPEKTVPLIRRAMRLRPEAGYLYYVLLGRAYYFLDDCAQAEINLGEALSRNAANIEARLYHIACLARQGDLDEAEWEVEEIDTLAAGFTVDTWLTTYPMTDPSQLTVFAGDLHRAGLN